MGTNDKMTRREFLKFLGSGAIFLGLGMTIGKLGNNLNLDSSSRSGNEQVFADTLGSWSLGVNLLTTPIHAGLLPSGKIFYLTGDAEVPANQNGPYFSGTLDVNTNSQKQIMVPADISCGGNCLLPSGNILLGGGTLSWSKFNSNNKVWGLNSAFEFNSKSESYSQLPSMAHGRWYPTFITLPNGAVLVVSGLDEFGCFNRLVEIYDPNTKSFTLNFDQKNNSTYCVGGCTHVPGSGLPCYGGTNSGVAPIDTLYPRMHVMPNGLLALVSATVTLRTWNQSNGHWWNAGTMTTTRSYGTSVLLPLQNTPTETGKILVAGGAPTPTSLATNSCEIITPQGAALNSELTNPMNFAREFLNAVILPNGKVVVNGGAIQQGTASNAVYAAEMFDPLTNTWTVMSSATVPRMYHSVAILLQDGRIWTAGTTATNPPIGELRTEIFSPSYVFTNRPIIAGAPTITGGYGGSINIPTENAADIESISLIRISSCTHHFNTDQRLIWLQIQNRTSNSVTVSAPINAKLAPPGYYLIHILDGSLIPSVGKFIKMPS